MVRDNTTDELHVTAVSVGVELDRELSVLNVVRRIEESRAS